MKGSAGLEHSKAYCEFLKICYENDVIPNSCKVKLNAKPCPSNVIAKLRAQNIREASKKELELAIKTQELVTRETSWSEQNCLKHTEDEGQEEEINQGSRSVEKLAACAASTHQTRGRTPAP